MATTLDDRLDRVFEPKTAKVLTEAFGLHTVRDLLRHYPRRYERRGELTDLASLRPGEHVTVLAEIAAVGTRRMRQRKGSVLDVTVTDGHGKLTLTFFSGGVRQPWRERELRPGLYGLFAGEVSVFNGKRQLVHPDLELLGDADPGTELAAEYAAEFIPVYPATRKLASWKIAKAVRTVLDTLDAGDDPLPPGIRERYGLCGLEEALRAIHHPIDLPDAEQAQKRLKWDEALVLQAALAQRRHAAAEMPAMPRPPIPDGIAAAFDARLPFSLTDGQRGAGATIATDLACAHPMHRLLQGEVGSGKTVIAVRAMLQVIDAGGQAALLAPTEVLAQQHYRSISELLGPLGQAGTLDGAAASTRIALLTGSRGAAARREALDDLQLGGVGILIGTHALLEEHVRFADLGLVVIDEQHRFGVEQRDALRAKAADGRPHVLVMTATPIPRTVAMTVFGDLEVSTLAELPAGRSPISTHVVPAAAKPHYLERAWERVREEAARGRQAYVVCPRIGGDESADALEEAGPAEEDGTAAAPAGEARRPPLAVLDVAPELEAGPLAGLRVGVLHGRLHPDEKDRVMRAFAGGSIDVLVATTVVEVGVDVPNATAMVILDADRFGVSQLHQLRGRVGRGTAEGLCLLVTEVPADARARERLDAVAATLDGFELSRLDLEQRREGDVLGRVQSGRQSSLKLLRLLCDEDLIGQAREEASALVNADPRLAGHPALAAAIAGLLGDEAGYLEKT